MISSNHHAAVRRQHLPGDEGGPAGSQKFDGFGHLLRPADPAQGGVLPQLGQGLGGQIPVHVGADDSGGHAVHPDVRGPQLLGQGLGQADDPRLGGGVGRLDRKSVV